MKYVMLTKPDTENISDVFYSVTIPPDTTPEGVLDRWNNLALSSPVIGKIFSGYSNVMLGSVWNEESNTLTMAEGISADQAFSPEANYYALLVNNVIGGIIKTKSRKHEIEKFTAAFADPITIIALEDDHPADVGYTYNGSTFFAPETL